MQTGLMYPFRFFDAATGEPELSDNTFYCKDYIHEEYINMSLTQQRLLPFGFRFTGAAAAATFNSATVSASIVCNKSGGTVSITLSGADWVQEDYNDARYVMNKGLTAFTVASKVLPGIYHIRISFQMGVATFHFYSDSFKLNRVLV